ncbi:MAG: helix-turn-helix domain-containing protein [Bdellovibrionota bacterium]|nr:helix-turn-helix domain-containing protein [Bdellovibrionota bacterium]
MNYQAYKPRSDLQSLINRYWTLEVPNTVAPQKQRIIPDGCIEMAFILGDDIKRYTSEEEFILQPRAMVLGQTLEPFYIEPVGNVNTFAVSFYPFGFANLILEPIENLVNKETPMKNLFEEAVANELENKIIGASDTKGRIEIVEEFLCDMLNDDLTIDTIVKSTVDILLNSKGNAPINKIIQDDPSKRRQLERKFRKQIGISPKQLGKIFRLQSVIKMLLNEKTEDLASIAYKNEYYDQAHFNKDFKEFTGLNPTDFLGNKSMALSSLFYK